MVIMVAVNSIALQSVYMGFYFSYSFTVLRISLAEYYYLALEVLVS